MKESELMKESINNMIPSELGLKRYKAFVDHRDHSYEEPDGWPYVKFVEDSKGGLVSASDLEAAIECGKLIPRSQLEELIERYITAFEIGIRRVLKETKP